MDRGYVPRQLCLQALRYSMGELADTARRRLTSLPDPNLCPRWTTVVTRPPALELGADDVWVTPVAVLSDGDVITGNALGLVRRWRTDQPGVPAELGSQDSAVSAVAVLFTIASSPAAMDGCGCGAPTSPGCLSSSAPTTGRSLH